MMKPIETLDDLQRGLAALRLCDPRLEAVIALSGPLPLRRRPATLGSLMQIVVSQQVSVASAAAIWQRFTAAYDPQQPGLIVAARPDELCATGLSRPKVRTLQALALAAFEGRLDFAALCERSGTDVEASLVALHGIGPWTADIFRLFCLGDPDVFPAGDIALQQAVGDAFALGGRPDAAALARMAKDWSPWRGVAARLFWAYYAQTRKKRSVLPV